MTDEKGGAVETARGMYPGKSTLCYGVQWDAVMRWISKDSNLSKYLTNSDGKGNYKDKDSSNNPANTGSNPAYQMKNIYDMAGNVHEWTMEASYTLFRVHRGGNYKYYRLPVQIVQSRAAAATIRTAAATKSVFVSLYMCRTECCENLIYKM